MQWPCPLGASFYISITCSRPTLYGPHSRASGNHNDYSFFFQTIQPPLSLNVYIYLRFHSFHFLPSPLHEQFPLSFSWCFWIQFADNMISNLTCDRGRCSWDRFDSTQTILDILGEGIVNIADNVPYIPLLFTCTSILGSYQELLVGIQPPFIFSLLNTLNMLKYNILRVNVHTKWSSNHAYGLATIPSLRAIRRTILVFAIEASKRNSLIPSSLICNKLGLSSSVPSEALTFQNLNSVPVWSDKELIRRQSTK